jgi:outer membrane receptor protein involved in Fe transport
MYRTTNCLRALTLALSLYAGLAPAQVSEESVDEVVVTATRRSVESSSVSAAVSVVSADELRQQKLLTDALAAAPGVFLQQTTPGQGAAIVRGQRGSAVLHLVDGMRLNNAIFRSAPTQYLALVPASAVQRVEVLRGTPTSLYGSDAVGGAIQVVSRVPSFDSTASEIRGDAMLGYESAESTRLARASLDVGNSRVATSVSGEYLKTGDRTVGGGETIRPSGYSAKGGRLLMSVTPNDERTWLFDVQFMEQAKTPRVDELVPGFGQTEPSSSEFFFAPNRRLFAHVKYEQLNGPLHLDWRLDAAWQRIDDDRITRDFQSTTRRTEANRSDLSGLMLTTSRVDEAASWVGGVEYYTDKVTSSRADTDITTGQTAAIAARFPDGSSIDQFALFVNGERRVLARSRLSGGLRYSAVDIRLPASPATPAATLSIGDGSGDLGWLFDLSAEWQLTANLGLGFRAPNIFDLGTLGNRPGNRFNVPNTALAAERVTQFDVGARWTTDRWRIAVVAYSLDYDDRIVSVLTGDVTPEGRDVVQSVNAAKSRVAGIELEFGAELGDGISVAATATYSRGEQTIDSVTEPGDRIPPLSGRLLLTWDPGSDWSASTFVSFAKAQDRLSSRDIRDIRIDPNGTNGWGTLNARASWQPDSRWEVIAGLDNVLDKAYRRHGSGIDAPGRNLSISVRRTW